ncbi:hypothetical protein ABZ579_30095, partial [Streptomyces thermolilacinus]
LLDTARLLVSELVTNAVLHARTEVEVSAHSYDAIDAERWHKDGGGPPARLVLTPSGRAGQSSGRTDRRRTGMRPVPRLGHGPHPRLRPPRRR